MGNSRILVVEDDPDVRELLQLELGQADYSVITAGDGRTGLEKARSDPPDVIVLDVGLPDLDGLTLCRELRKSSKVPILMLSGNREDTDKILGLEFGADDYLTKPYNPRELVARVRALLRRAQRFEAEDEREQFEFGDLHLDRSTHQARAFGQVLPLTPIEFSLLELFMRRPGRALSRQQLLDEVWGQDFEGAERTVDSHVRNLRSKLKGTRPRIVSVRGIGYKLDV